MENICESIIEIGFVKKKQLDYLVIKKYELLAFAASLLKKSAYVQAAGTGSTTAIFPL
jgi:hypothetical protein